MDYSDIRVAKRALEVAGTPVPNEESEIRRKAYEYLLDKDFLTLTQSGWVRITLRLHVMTGRR